MTELSAFIVNDGRCDVSNCLYVFSVNCHLGNVQRLDRYHALSYFGNRGVYYYYYYYYYYYVLDVIIMIIIGKFNAVTGMPYALCTWLLCLLLCF